jgi:hypothetical protein
VGRGSFGTDEEAGSVAVSDLGVSQTSGPEWRGGPLTVQEIDLGQSAGPVRFRTDQPGGLSVRRSATVSTVIVLDAGSASTFQVRPSTLRSSVDLNGWWPAQSAPLPASPVQCESAGTGRAGGRRPRDADERADWGDEAGWAASYRGLVEHTDAEDPLGAALVAALSDLTGSSRIRAALMSRRPSASSSAFPALSANPALAPLSC